MSTATVSRVIHSTEKVSSETRKRVYRAMDICRYRFNAFARGCVAKCFHTFSLIIPTITNPIFAESTRRAQDFSNEHGFQVILGSSDYQF
ncbi:MAG: LacI family DNA-binding transcriptional regulator [Deltaproteobacteria bacterium]|nr:MAG: LacI family DNA-binding transcriptional regulator [Deltaproteobacteria bacterium]